VLPHDEKAASYGLKKTEVLEKFGTPSSQNENKKGDISYEFKSPKGGGTLHFTCKSKVCTEMKVSWNRGGLY